MAVRNLAKKEDKLQPVVNSILDAHHARVCTPEQFENLIVLLVDNPFLVAKAVREWNSMKRNSGSGVSIGQILQVAANECRVEVRINERKNVEVINPHVPYRHDRLDPQLDGPPVKKNRLLSR